MDTNHRAVVAAEGLRHYENRSYTLGTMDRRHFNALNPGNHVSALNGYCLDALDSIPAGGMCMSCRLPTQCSEVRGMSTAELRELDALAARLIAELLAEEAKESR